MDQTDLRRLGQHKKNQSTGRTLCNDSNALLNDFGKDTRVLGGGRCE